MRIGKLEVTAPFFLMLAWLNYLDRQGLVPLCVLACCFHELGHLLSIRLLSGDIKLIRLTAVGAEMVLCRPMGYGQEMVAALAGPGVNLLLAVLCCRWSCTGGDALSSLSADGFAYEGQSSHARRIDALSRHRVSGCRCRSFHLRPAFAGNGRLDGAVRFLHGCHIALGIVRSTGRYPSNDRLAVFKRQVMYCFLKKKYFSTIVS